MKLTKKQIKQHEEALKILEKDKLTFDDKLFVLENWHEGAENNNALAGAFFTPYGLARDFKLEIYEENNRLIDLCSGIGALSLPHYSFCEFYEIQHDITCIELNPNYIEVGKKILPNAKWIQASALDLDFLKTLGKFDQAISNPPFGKIKTAQTVDSNKELKYKGAEFEFKLMEVGSKIADYGTFLIPQTSTPFKYSGGQYFEDLRREDEGSRLPNKVKKFIKETGLEYQFGVGVDTTYYLDEWKGVKPTCEIVNFDFNVST
ncbi:methyltransferase [Marinifilum breve]|uniref:Methyltransferase n=1 Tax=Marinifilum breve TaxID=2184082 RepID=A0A2V4ABL8_9BACT|nr:methyltransferase [Marinifilum breve]PXY01414.1 methyltransferase [Marinifilum breve]